MNLQVELCWRLGQGDDLRLEPRLFELLSGIEEQGSLRAAADEIRLSYRHAWALVQRWSAAFGQPLVTLERGRGAKLSALGHKLLWAERRLTARLAPELESLSSQVNRELASLLQEKALARLRVVASHDLALLVLRQLFSQATSIKLDLEFRGSLESLKWLHAKKCDLAGFHVAEGRLGARLSKRYKPWLDHDSHRLITVARRAQGWLTRDRDSPTGEMLPALSNSKLRFVNRQPGSGTRLAFDQLTKDAGIDPQTIRGFETEEFTHLAVAAMVAGDAADVALGIHAAGAQFGLRFKSVFCERYMLAVRREALHTPGIAALIKLLKSPEFQQQTAAMAGYDCAEAGTVFEVEAFFAGVGGDGY